jgi:hypothetical protein
MDDDRLDRRMTALARSFPSMHNAPGIEPWRPPDLDRWAAGPASSGERVTARFLLAVWDPSAPWDCGPFDAMEALAVWDLKHRDAFLEWASDPWWS